MGKIQKQFIDYGCGFPVILKDVPMVHVRGVWTPNVDYDVFHKAVLLALAHKPARLTGNQIKFVRHFVGLTLAEFGEYFDVSHPAVLKWENAGDNVPRIKWSIERDIRLFILDKLNETSRHIGKLYRELRSVARPPKSNKLNLDSFFPSHGDGDGYGYGDGEGTAAGYEDGAGEGAGSGDVSDDEDQSPDRE